MPFAQLKLKGPQRSGPEQAPGRAAASRESLPTTVAPAANPLQDSPRMVAQRRSLQALQPDEPSARSSAGNRGLPDALKQGVEALSGVSMDGVSVHRNSTRPAQLQAHAFAQGNEIHLGPGQDAHLPHEAWHVAQQRQGRVPVTSNVGSEPLNDDAALEAEADAKGRQAMQRMPQTPSAEPEPGMRQPAPGDARTSGPAAVQRVTVGRPHSDITLPPNPKKFEGGTRNPKYIEMQRLFREQSAREMQGFRQVQADNVIAEQRSDHPPQDEVKPTTGQTLFNVPQKIIDRNSRHLYPVGEAQPQPKPNGERRQRLLERLAKARDQRPAPRVAVSYRPGFGYDEGAFTRSRINTRMPTPEVRSAPGEFKTLPQKSPTDQQEQDAIKLRVRDVKDRALRLQELHQTEERGGPTSQRSDPVDQLLGNAQGLFIPGGQDREVPDEERNSRQAYERELVRVARNRGLPTLAVCGGSRALGLGFGGREQTLSEPEQAIHSAHGGLNAQAHGIQFPEVASVLGGAAPMNRNPETGRSKDDEREGRHPSRALDTLLGVGTRKEPGDKPATDRQSRLPGVDKVNSTHVKVLAHDEQGRVESNRLPNGQSELMTTALSDDRTPHPEGFETRYGAPIMGITSHPEAIRGASSAAYNNATAQGREFSGNVFSQFIQSMQTYGGKRQVNDDITRQASAIERRSAKGISEGELKDHREREDEAKRSK